MMTRARSLLVLLGTLVLAAVLVLPVGATPPRQASGTGVVTAFVPTSVETHGGNTVIEGYVTSTLAGTLSGSVYETFRDVIHADGSDEYHAHGTFTGSVGDCGPATIPFNSRSFGGSLGFSGPSTGHDPVSGTHYNITLTGGGSVFTYSGTYHC